MSIAVQSVSPSTLAGIDPQLVSNAGVVVLDDFLVMIDAGMRPDSARSLRADLEARTGRPVRYFCLTHYHADHAFSLAAFKDTLILASDQVLANLASSPDWTPQALAAMKKNHPPGDWVDEVKLVPPSLVFSDRLEVRDGQRAVEFHHSGGHTSCSVWAHLPDERVLFAGDLLFSGEFPYAGDPTCDPEPRHGFSTQCTLDNKGCCTVAPGRANGASRLPESLLVAAFLTIGVARRRRSSRRS